MDGKTHQSYHLDPIGKMTVVDEIVERLMGLIIDENLKPGDKLLTERELMERLAVGRSSLREAIKTLCALGVLEIKRGKGTYVGYGDMSILTKPLAWGLFLSQSSVQQVIEARSAIEVSLAGWAAERATEDEVAIMREQLRQMEANLGDMEGYIDADIRFHLAIAEAAHNELFSHVLGIFQRVLRVWMETTYKESGGTECSMGQHRTILAAIGTQDVDKAREIMAAHTSGAPLLAAAAKAGTGD